MSTLYRALVRYAESSPTVTPPYFKSVKFQWQLDLDASGRPIGSELVPLTSTETRQNGKIAELAWVEVLAPSVTRTVGIVPFLASDGIAYVLGWSDDQMPETKASVRHQAYVRLVEDWADSPEAADDPVPRALAAFLKTYLLDVTRPAEPWTSKDNVLVTVAGTHAHLAPSARPYWSRVAGASKSSGVSGLCLICGREGLLVDTFAQNVKGPLAPGGQSSGVAPISINESVYGFGLRRGLGQVPVCESCAYAIPAALNELLADPKRSHRDANAATTWWIDGDADLDPYDMISAADERSVSEFLGSVLRGRATPGAFEPEEFHALTVSGNAARLVLRRWHHVPITVLKQNIAAWFEDTEIEPHWATGRRHHPLWMLAESTGRYDGTRSRYHRPDDNAGKHPHGITQYLEDAAIGGEPIPPAVLAHLVQRIAADQRIDDRRAALLRLALTRSPRTKEKTMPGLDPDNTAPCYVLGRLFAAYESLQLRAARADGGSVPNATYADKHLAGAIGAPHLVLSTGERQSAAWLSKLRRSGRDHYHRAEIDEIVGLLDPSQPLPARASTNEQALFVLGYHHQRAAIQRSKDAAAAAKQTSAESDPTHEG